MPSEQYKTEVTSCCAAIIDAAIITADSTGQDGTNPRHIQSNISSEHTETLSLEDRGFFPVAQSSWSGIWLV